MQNIDDFNRGATLILAKLYGQFPIPCHFAVAELDEHEDLPPSDTDRRVQRVEIYTAAVRFLADEGYIRFSGSTGQNRFFMDVVLTSKGLAALQKSPESLAAKPSKTLGDVFTESSGDLFKDGVKEAIRQAIRILLS